VRHAIGSHGRDAGEAESANTVARLPALAIHARTMALEMQYTFLSDEEDLTDASGDHIQRR